MEVFPFQLVFIQKVILSNFTWIQQLPNNNVSDERKWWEERGKKQQYLTSLT